jgi:dTDP-4-amino-4,6-dideoxygalactose transaminase
MRKYKTQSPSSAAIEAIERYLLAAGSEPVSKMHLLGTGAVADLEEKLRRHYGMRHALCVSNATSGLLGLALAIELREAEFVTTPYTYGASLAGWLLLGNRPRFADIAPHDLGLDPDAVIRTITPATKALLSVDIFGIPSDSRTLRQLADEFGIWYVADAAQSFGSQRDGLPGAGFADAIVVSFTTGKTVFAGEGGAILTNHSELYEKLLWHTQHPERQRRELSLALWNEFAVNARIHPIAAVWASVAFEASLNALSERRQWCFEVIDLLNASGKVEPIEFRKRHIAPSFYRLTASWKAKPFSAKLCTWLLANGTSARIEPSPVRLIYQQPAFQARYEPAEKPCCPTAEHQERTRFCIVPDDQLGET